VKSKLQLGLLLAATASLAHAQNYTVAGRVVNAETGSALPGAQVTLSASPNDSLDADASAPRFRSRPSDNPSSQSVLTSSDGVFRFNHLPAGRYSLSGTRRGFLMASYQEHGVYSSAIVAGQGLISEGLILKLSPGASITGSITDDAGDPVDQASVNLYRQLDDGFESIRAYRVTQTDDVGAYEFSHLPPGTYFVSASGRPWYAVAAQPEEQTARDAASKPTPGSASNLDVVFPRSYYADATDSAGATPIPLRGGEQVRVNLQMNAVPAVHLTVKMPAPNSDDQPARTGGRGFQVPRLEEQIFGELDGTTGVSGRVTFQGGPDHQSITMSVPPGQYQLEDAGYTLAVNASSNVLLDPRTGVPPALVTGSVGSAGGAALPHSLTLRLTLANGRLNVALPAGEHHGTYTFDAVPPGDYELSAEGGGEKLSVVQIAAQGASVEGHILRIDSRPVTFAATLAPASSSVSGYAQQGGHPASGVMVVLVPEHPADHSFYRRDQSDSDGSFSMHDVAAGNYTLVAIRNGWDLDWARPEVITHYLPGGEPVTVPSSPTTIHPARPVTVQPR
jgi:5-hydroxyisourate hydrolase-like protein (transthyretin family)